MTALVMIDLATFSRAYPHATRCLLFGTLQALKPKHVSLNTCLVPDSFIPGATVQGYAAEQIYSALGSSPKTMSQAGNVSVSLSSGVIAGVAAAIISHPADTLLSKVNKAGAGGTGSVTSRLVNIARETGMWKLCTQGLGARCVMIGTLTAGQFGIFDSVMSLLGASKFHFHDPAEGHH